MSQLMNDRTWKLRRSEIIVVTTIIAIAASLLIVVNGRLRESAAHTKQMNNFKQLGLAVQNYCDAYLGKYPAHARYSGDGTTPLSSWRVTIVPYIESDNFYRRYRHDEPWDSPHNFEMIPESYSCYRHPDQSKNDSRTHCQLIVGDGAFWKKQPVGPTDTGVKARLNTILMIVEAHVPVVWTKPDDLDYSARQPLPEIGLNLRRPFLATMLDGSVRSFDRSVPEKMILAAITADND